MTDNHKSPLRPEGEDLLQAALSDPFSVPGLPRVSPFQPANAAPPLVSAAAAAPPEPSPSSEQPALPPTATSPESSVSPAEFDAWKAEYESQVAEWRRQSATVRARAEAERARWEERRAHEQQEPDADADVRRDTDASEAGTEPELGTSMASASEWEAVSPDGGHPAAPVSTTAAPPGAGGPPHPESNLAPPSSAADTLAAPRTTDPTGSPNWENLPSSPTSSFPSMSFPEPSRPHSPEHTHPPRAAPAAAASAAPPLAAASATLAVFDDTLPKRTRVWALITSLSVNMLLPFVNGVMLGFGEIFAKTVIVGWLGWGPAVATNVGLGVRSGSRQR